MDMETEKLLARIGTARDAISSKSEQTSLDYMIDGVLMNCSVMLKEQEEIRHGEWKWSHGGECSECGYHNNNFNYKYCPMCGAMMDA